MAVYQPEFRDGQPYVIADELRSLEEKVPVPTVVTTAATDSSPFGFSQAQADSIVSSLNALISACKARGIVG